MKKLPLLSCLVTGEGFEMCPVQAELWAVIIKLGLMLGTVAFSQS